MLLGAFRGGNPLERIVGVPFLWHLATEFLKSAHRALYSRMRSVCKHWLIHRY
jgi:hypothetical protein